MFFVLVLYIFENYKGLLSSYFHYQFLTRDVYFLIFSYCDFLLSWSWKALSTSTDFKPIKTLKIRMTTHSSLSRYTTNIDRLSRVAINRSSFYSLKCFNLDDKLYSCNTINKRKSLNFEIGKLYPTSDNLSNFFKFQFTTMAIYLIRLL